MSSKFFISVLAAVATIAVVSARQDPSFDYPGAEHVGFDVLGQKGHSQSHEGKVSVTFQNATVREVLGWLKDQGVEFVVGDDQVNKDSHVSIHVENESIEDVMKALAESWGGQWEKRNGIWVFHKGDVFFRDGGQNGSPEYQIFRSRNPGLAKERQDALDRALKNENDSKAWEDYARAWQKWSDENSKRWEEWSKVQEQRSQELQKSMGELDGKLNDKKMDELRRQAEEMAKRSKNFVLTPDAKGFVFSDGDLKPMDKEQMKKLEDQLRQMQGKGFMDEEQIETLEKRAEEMAKQSKNFKVLPDGKTFYYQDGEIQPFDQKRMKELMDKVRAAQGDAFVDKEQVKALAKRAEEMAKQSRDFKIVVPDGKTFVFRNGREDPFSPPQISIRSSSSHNLKEIYESLTPTQQNKLDTFGYLNYSDLNAKQRKLFGVMTQDGSWTVSYKTDKVNLTIKSDR